MKTQCPACQTTFRVTPDQLKARAGKVRCGQCAHIFNALDFLVEDAPASAPAPVATPAPEIPLPVIDDDRVDLSETIIVQPPAWHLEEPEAAPAPAIATPYEPKIDDFPQDETRPPWEAPANAGDETVIFRPTEPYIGESPAPAEPVDAKPLATPANIAAVEPALDAATPTEPAPLPFSAIDPEEFGKAHGLVAARDSRDIPGYSKWDEGTLSQEISFADEKAPPRWPFITAAILVSLTLAGQLVFYFRTDLGALLPPLKPAITRFAGFFGASMPLPRHSELISIENSDLQLDPAHDNLFVLNATLRNRAGYEQAYPMLELSLTDTQDSAIARRVFKPEEYLPGKTDPKQAFKGNADLAIRLWLDAKEIAATGYRLYVFYP